MRRFLPFVAIVLVSGCGGASNVPRVSSPFTDEDARVFDGAVDYVSEPAILEGRWHDDWMGDLVHRVRSSDIVARVTVRTLRSDTDPDRRHTYRIHATVDDMLVGEDLSEVNLRVRQDEAGFDTITGKEGRILDHSFVVFIKWQQVDEENDEIVARWHMSPASSDVLNQVTAALAQRERAERAEREAERQGR